MTDDQDQDQPHGRPPARDKTVGVRVDPETFARAEAKAKKSGRSLGAILRSFLYLWAIDEIKGDPPILPGESTRAKKRPKKPKK